MAFRYLFLGVLSLALSACASSPRPQIAPDAIAAAAADPMGGIRFRAGDAPTVPPRATAAAQHILLLSGGGPDGAYGVGLLRGWQARGDLPQFDVVTGVSTGALMAPFAFLGGERLAELEALYTGDDVTRILSQGSPLRLVSGPAIYRPKRLRGLIAANITPAMLAAIAAEHAKGRRLYIATANIDAQVRHIWDMGAIAARATPESAALFHDLLLAAASIPIAFDPVGIAVPTASGGITELHADATLFGLIYSDARLFDTARCRAAPGRCTLYVIAHNKTRPEPRTVPLSVAKVGARALDTLIKADLATKLRVARDEAADAGAAFHFAYLDLPFEGVSAIDFDPDYMRKIFAIGRDRGQAGINWLGDVP
jgi:hypothetical protein